MKNWARVTLLILLAALVAAVACYAVLRFYPRHQIAHASDYHYWIHTKLGLTAEQEKELEPIEAKFAAQRKELMARLREGNAALARAIDEDRADSQRVKDAVQEIHRAQGELQNAVLAHVFDMRPALTPEQYDRLIRMTADALRDAPELQ